MHFERTLTTDISSDFMQSEVGWGVPLTQYIVCHRQSTKEFTSQWSFQQIKKIIIYTLVGGHVTYTIACNSNAAVLSAVGYPRRTLFSSDDTCSHGEGITSDDFS